MRPLDFVKTPKGQIAIITEVNYYGKVAEQASITFIGDQQPGMYEKCAWWSRDELTIINNLPHLLAEAMIHPFGNGKKSVNKTYPQFKKGE